MSIQNKDPMGFRRFSLGFLGFINWMGVWIWLLMIIRSGEFLQENYYFFNGNMLYTFCLLFCIPMCGIAFYKWNYVRIRQILSGLQLVSLGFMAYLLRDYYEFVALVPVSGYTMIGTFLQRNIVFVSILSWSLFTSFVLCLQLIIYPNKLPYGEKEFRSTAGVGIFPLNMNDQFSLIGQIFGGGLMGTVVCLWALNFLDASWWLISFYVFLLFGLIFVWISSRKPYQPREEPFPYEKDERWVKNSKIHLAFSIVAGIGALIGIYFMNSFNSFGFLGVVAGIFAFIGLGRLIMDFGYRARKQSDFESSNFTKRISRDTWLFSAFTVFGGALIFLCGYLYMVDVDRNLEFTSLMWLILIMGCSFIVVIYLVPILSPKLLLLLSCIAILSCLLLELRIADFAASNASYWENRMKIIAGFAFHQSLESAVLCGIPIGVVFAIYFSYYTRYCHETHQLGINLEIPLSMFLVFLSAGIVYGHDIKYSGLNVTENLETAMDNFNLFSILYYIMMGITLLSAFIALRLLYIQILQERKKHDLK